MHGFTQKPSDTSITLLYSMLLTDLGKFPECPTSLITQYQNNNRESATKNLLPLYFYSSNSYFKSCALPSQKKITCNRNLRFYNLPDWSTQMYLNWCITPISESDITKKKISISFCAGNNQMNVFCTKKFTSLYMKTHRVLSQNTWKMQYPWRSS